MQCPPFIIPLYRSSHCLCSAPVSLLGHRKPMPAPLMRLERKVVPVPMLPDVIASLQTR